MAIGKSQKEIATELGISDRTIQRWLKVGEFKNALEGVPCDLVEVSSVERINPFQERRKRLGRLLDRAVDVVEEVLNDSEAKTADRLKAAVTIGEWVGVGKTSDYESALMCLYELGWISGDVIEEAQAGALEFKERIQRSLTCQIKSVG